MKKNIILLLLLFISMFIPNFVSAAGTDKFYIDVKVNDDGSATFSEYVVFSGDYNYLERSLYYKGNTKIFTGLSSDDFYKTDIYNASGIKDICVSDESLNINDFSYTNNNHECYQLTNSGYKGMTGYYELENYNNEVLLRIYNHSSNNTGFYIRYTITDAVVIHNDIAELMYNFSWSELIDDIKFKVVLPNDSNELRVYTHGPVNGINSIVNRKTTDASWDFLNSDELVDMRVVFDKSLVPNGTKTTNVDALDKIIDFETKQAEIQNEIRENAKKQMYVTYIVCIVWIIGLIIIVYNFYKKFDKEYKSNFNIDYMRELPATYGPEVLGYLLTKSDIKSEYLSASIMELIRKKYFKLEMNMENKKDFEIHLDKTNIELTSSEKLLSDWLINDVGDGTKFTNDDMKDASKKHYSEFLSKYSLWKNDVIANGIKEQFFENITGKKVLYSIYCIIGGFIGFIFLSAGYGSVLAGIVIISAIIALIYFLLATKRTIKGNEDYVRWVAFKKFLLDFGRMQEKEVPEVYLWEKYLVYATAFGIADKVQKAMQMKIKELNYNENEFSSSPLFYYYYLGMGNNISNTINTSISKAISTASAASSAASSGSGFGGGSSFGGGGGGFGGGGGRG